MKSSDPFAQHELIFQSRRGVKSPHTGKPKPASWIRIQYDKPYIGRAYWFDVRDQDWEYVTESQNVEYEASYIAAMQDFSVITTEQAIAQLRNLIDPCGTCLSGKTPYPESYITDGHGKRTYFYGKCPECEVNCG